MKIGLIAHYGEDFYKSRIDFLAFLKGKGCETYALVPKDEYFDKIKELSEDVYFYSYKRNWAFVFSLLSTYKLFVKRIKVEKSDLVFTYKFFPNIVGVLAARRAKVSKIVATIAGIGFLEKKDSSIAIKLIFYVYMWVLNKANYVVIQNIDDLKLLEKYLKRPKLILTNGSGVNPEAFINGKNYNSSFLEVNNLSKDSKYITFCSRIVREKGIIELISAFNLLYDFKYNLLIAGWFDDKGIEIEVMKLIEANPRIHFLGYQKNVTDLLSVSDAVVLPSYYPEGVPRSLIEAMSLGKVIITTNHKGCKETCLDDKNGYLVEVKSIDSLVEALEKLNTLSEEKIRMFKETSVELFNKKFHRDVVFDTIWDGIE
ncbi:glycosyltransferase [Myroides marinus]|uniref:glycosyltransferase n=1 Tax=Myroides marinus TaxID=703342 RepID=UPI0025771F36|nr:glycosyltransferase [Myroides marinus]MDM1376762.1 glycosyltransferase [Myroides marinus]